jgi:hypothetical protein
MFNYSCSELVPHYLMFIFPQYFVAGTISLGAPLPRISLLAMQQLPHLIRIRNFRICPDPSLLVTQRPFRTFPPLFHSTNYTCLLKPSWPPGAALILWPHISSLHLHPHSLHLHSLHLCCLHFLALVVFLWPPGG